MLTPHHPFRKLKVRPSSIANEHFRRRVWPLKYSLLGRTQPRNVIGFCNSNFINSYVSSFGVKHADSSWSKHSLTNPVTYRKVNPTTVHLSPPPTHLTSLWSAFDSKYDFAHSSLRLESFKKLPLLAVLIKMHFEFFASLSI